MVKQFLITRPMHDKETSYLHSFSKAIVHIVKENQLIHLTHLEGPQANRRGVENSLNTRMKTLAFFNGHGDDETVFGHDDQPVLDKKNIRLAKDKIIYALACNSLVKLGPLAINKGAIAYIGYKDEFMWVGDPSKSAVPDKDKNSAPFRKVNHQLINDLVNGTPVGITLSKAKLQYKKLIKHYGTSKDNFGDAPSIGLALAWDLLCLDMVGDATAAF